MKSGAEGASPGPVRSGRGRWQAAQPQAPCPHAEATLGPHLHRLRFCTGPRLCSRDPLGQAAQGPSSPACLHLSVRRPSFRRALTELWVVLHPAGSGTVTQETPRALTGTAGVGAGLPGGRGRMGRGLVDKGFQERECLCGRKERKRAGHMEGLTPQGHRGPGGTSAAGAQKGLFLGTGSSPLAWLPGGLSEQWWLGGPSGGRHSPGGAEKSREMETPGPQSSGL